MSILKDLLIEDYSLVFKDSVLLIDGIPYMILGFNGTKAECLNIGNQDFNKIDFLKIKTVNLPNTGMVNYRGVVGYLERIPCRKFKHGLSKENCTITTSENVPNEDWHYKVQDLRNTCRMLTPKQMFNTYKNIYPSLDDALELLEDDAYQVAFDRQFAVDCEGRLQYKNSIVGRVINPLKVVFEKQYEFLRVALPRELQ